MYHQLTAPVTEFDYFTQTYTNYIVQKSTTIRSSPKTKQKFTHVRNEISSIMTKKIIF